MQTFNDFLAKVSLAKRAKEPSLINEIMQSALVSFTVDVKRIVHALAIIMETNSDLEDALKVAREVISQRLEGDPKEWQGDEKRWFERLFSSVEKETKEAVRYAFADTTGKVPLNIASFNNMAVEKIIDTVRVFGPVDALKIIPTLFNTAEKIATDATLEYNDEVVEQAFNTLQFYRKQRVETVKKKKATRSSKKERLKIIRTAARNLSEA